MRGVQRNGNSGKYIVAFSRSLLNHKFGLSLLQRKQKRYVPKCVTNAWSHCFCSLNLLFVELVLFHVPKWIKISLLVYTAGVILAIYATRAEWHLASRAARDSAESWMAFIFNHSEQRQSICLSVSLVILRYTGGLRVILYRANQALKLKKKIGQTSLQTHIVMVKLQVFSDNQGKFRLPSPHCHKTRGTFKDQQIVGEGLKLVKVCHSLEKIALRTKLFRLSFDLQRLKFIFALSKVHCWRSLTPTPSCSKPY